MNSYKRVLDILYKKTGVELKAEQVNLSIESELNSLLQQASGLAAKGINNAKTLEANFKTINKMNKDILRQLESIETKAVKIVVEARKKAKDIGITPPREWDDIYEKITAGLLDVPHSDRTKALEKKGI
ncbi:MAG: hypothetical protein Unbinned3907contig1000_11 [Prokaryotic dsDNA virus sp.]|nr:MAG: hypothetical protein Unbinned3907contig1000_11 [Prokaryotic dsDNA virus sp.]|tara:strand:- start:4287 stop:4673 length:387 start_codon:yes stop_codon:yes gene_type:complete